MSFNEDGPDRRFVFDEVESAPSDFDDTTRENYFEGLPRNSKGSFFSFFPLFQWPSFLVFLALTLLLFFNWLFTSELFCVPEVVSQSRRQFTQAKIRYESQPHYWDMKLDQVIASLYKEDPSLGDTRIIQKLQEVSSEMWIAYLVNCLGFPLSRLDQVSLFPLEKEQDGLTLLIAKYEPGIWPLHIMLSLELLITLEAKKFNADVLRVRRGKQDIALGLSWAYFGSELEPLKKLELISPIVDNPVKPLAL